MVNVKKSMNSGFHFGSPTREVESWTRNVVPWFWGLAISGELFGCLLLLSDPLWAPGPYWVVFDNHVSLVLPQFPISSISCFHCPSDEWSVILVG